MRTELEHQHKYKFTINLINWKREWWNSNAKIQIDLILSKHIPHTHTYEKTDCYCMNLTLLAVRIYLQPDSSCETQLRLSQEATCCCKCAGIVCRYKINTNHVELRRVQGLWTVRLINIAPVLIFILFIFASFVETMEARSCANIFYITLLLYIAKSTASGRDDCLSLCTNEYSTLCANDYVTYGNTCKFECAKKQQPCLFIKWSGHCDDPYSKSSASSYANSDESSKEDSYSYISMSMSDNDISLWWKYVFDLPNSIFKITFLKIN